MKTELIQFKSKAWGLVNNPDHPGHFHTGYEGEWTNVADRWKLYHSIGVPKQHMVIGTNAIITGQFRIDKWSRGRSAANFHGHFKDHGGISYELSMDGAGHLWALVQDGTFPLVDGYIDGRWTFAKQGQNFFLKPDPA